VQLPRILGVLGVALWGVVPGASAPDRWFEHPKSPRIAGYRIHATLDWPRKLLQGRETITWRNTGAAPTQEIPLHLYLNAFKGPQTVFAREGGWDWAEGGSRRVTDPSSWGYCALREVRFEGRALQGHHGEDETVYWLSLPRTVAPGETIRLEVQWESRFPRLAARSGWSGSSPEGSGFLMGAQWFPKVGVYQGDAWNCHAYHASTEFFADFGVYDVDLSLPGNLVLAHTGTQVRPASPDPAVSGNVLRQLHAEDVHDFAWAAAPAGSWQVETRPYRGIQVQYFFPPRDRAGLDRQQAAVQAALKHSAEWFQSYPYPVLSVLDVPKEAAGADGMEYPTLFTAGMRPFEPSPLRADLDLPAWPHRIHGGPEEVAIHEFGHQYFQGLLASNEVEEPWLDEGFTSWFTRKTLERSYQSLFASRRFQVGTDYPSWLDYWSAPSVDPVTQVGFQMLDYGSYARSAYDKPVLILDQLEAMLGRPVMDRVMKAYTDEMAFRHPSRQDFKRIAERVSGRDLGAFWRDFVEGTDVLDVVIHAVDAQEQFRGGWMTAPEGQTFVAPQPDAPGRRGSITLFRRGGIIRPVILWVRLENRVEHRLTWDGKDRWVTYDFDSPVDAAILDPDGQYPILKDRLHASFTAKPVRRGFHYWSQLAWGALTALLQGIGLG
jgi:hypothetical protein